MSCIDCSNCAEATPLIPECADNSVYLGFALDGPGGIADLEFKIIRVTNIASGAVTEAVIEPDLSGTIIFTLADFDVDTSFWQTSQGAYKFEMIQRTGGEIIPIYNYDDNTVSAVCLLISFTPIDNVTGSIIIDFSAV